jgi:hypothetical protein
MKTFQRTNKEQTKNKLCLSIFVAGRFLSPDVFVSVGTNENELYFSFLSMKRSSGSRTFLTTYRK